MIISHHTDGWSSHARFCTRPKVSLLLYSKLCKYPTKVLQMRLQTRYPTCICTQRDRIHMLKTLQPMSEPDGLRKCQNNQACTESVRSLRSNNAGHRHCMRKKRTTQCKPQAYSPAAGAGSRLFASVAALCASRRLFLHLLDRWFPLLLLGRLFPFFCRCGGAGHTRVRL